MARQFPHLEPAHREFIQRQRLFCPRQPRPPSQEVRGRGPGFLPFFLLTWLDALGGVTTTGYYPDTGASRELAGCTPTMKNASPPRLKQKRGSAGSALKSGSQGVPGTSCEERVVAGHASMRSDFLTHALDIPRQPDVH